MEVQDGTDEGVMFTLQTTEGDYVALVGLDRSGDRPKLAGQPEYSATPIDGRASDLLGHRVPGAIVRAARSLLK